MIIADSRRVLLLREPGRMPVYYFPRSDVLSDIFRPSQRQEVCPHKGPIRYQHLDAGGVSRENAAWRCPEAIIQGRSLADYLAFDWNAMDGWFEEDEEVFVHPRDPYTRIDVLQGSQRVQIVGLGVMVADSRRPLLLFETGLPPRYYLPMTDVRMDLLLPSDTRTQCPYKGRAHYYHLNNGNTQVEDLFWSYRFPTLAMARIAGMLSFLPERAEAVSIDGEDLSME
jgi:uncharacterized protein (DUF427 family)